MSAEACRLDERCLIRVSGADAEDFLQNLVTNDVKALKPESLLYACLLTPQGRFLHDLFISRTADGFFLECETQRREDLIRRLTLFRLRAKVKIEDCFGRFQVYVALQPPHGVAAFPDPRLPDLGYRFYLPEGGDGISAVDSTVYRDLRISAGVAEGSPEIKPEVDTIANANLDYLHAVSWDKGCYVGQEVTAMTENRGVAKRRMVVISADRLSAGDELTQGGHFIGDIRAVHSSMRMGLALLKLAGLDDTADPITNAAGELVSARLPAWLALKKA